MNPEDQQRSEILRALPRSLNLFAMNQPNNSEAAPAATSTRVPLPGEEWNHPEHGTVQITRRYSPRECVGLCKKDGVRRLFNDVELKP